MAERLAMPAKPSKAARRTDGYSNSAFAPCCPRVGNGSLDVQEHTPSACGRQRRRAVKKKTTAFWDASALVHFCVHEAASPPARSHLRRFAPVL